MTDENPIRYMLFIPEHLPPRTPEQDAAFMEHLMELLTQPVSDLDLGCLRFHEDDDV